MIEYTVSIDISILGSKRFEQCLVLPVGSNFSVQEKFKDSLQKIMQFTLDDILFISKFGQAMFVPEKAGKYLCLISIADKTALTADEYIHLLSVAYKMVQSYSLTSVCSLLCGLDVIEKDDYWKVRREVQEVDTRFLSERHLPALAQQPATLKKVRLWSKVENQSAIEHAIAISRGISACKRLADLPANICTPSYIANEAVTLVADNELLDVSVLGEADMRDIGMNTLLSVGASSAQESQCVLMHYRGTNSDVKPYVLVGKGITFDTGGNCIKDREPMIQMKYDMGGAAAVFGAMVSLLELHLPINVVAILACAENMLGSNATRPGDVVTSLSGKTIEILNTDAEGRLVLCDALTFAERYDPEVVVDVATLTGASVVALGRHVSAMFANNEFLSTQLLQASERSMDPIWRLPLSTYDEKQLNSKFADLANIGDGSAACIVAALFLSQFTQNYPWAHLDISGTAKRSRPDRGSTGRPVSLLVQYLIDRAEESERN